MGTNCSPKNEGKIQEVEKDKDDYLDEYRKSQVILLEGYVLECVYLEVSWMCLSWSISSSLENKKSISKHAYKAQNLRLLVRYNVLSKKVCLSLYSIHAKLFP